jgi:hypothetical protein
MYKEEVRNVYTLSLKRFNKGGLGVTTPTNEK